MHARRSPLQIQIAVIGALILRETQTRYGRDNIGFLWLFIEPMIVTAIMAGIWFALGRGYESQQVIPFVITGYIPFLCWRYCNNRSMMALSANAGLLFHRNVRALDIFLSRIVLEVSGTFVAFVGLVMLISMLGLGEIDVELLPVLGGWILLTLFSVGTALILCAISEVSDVLERIWGPLSFLMLPLSGAFYRVDWLPSWLQEMALWLPIVHCIEMIRKGTLGGAPYYYDVTYVMLTSGFLMLAGLVLLRDVRTQLETS